MGAKHALWILAATVIALALAPGGGATSSGPYVVLNDTFYVKPSFTFEISRAVRGFRSSP